MKINLKRIGLIAIAAIIAFSFFACKTDNDLCDSCGNYPCSCTPHPGAAYFGDWVNTVGDAQADANCLGNNTLTISANSINAAFSAWNSHSGNLAGNGPTTRSITNLTWTPMTNPNTVTAYSTINALNLSGFKLEGTLGANTTYPMFVALMTNGNLVLNLIADSNDGIQFIFVRP